VKLVVSQAALQDIERLRVFVADKNQAAAQDIVTVLSHAIQSPDTNPDRGRPSSLPGARELIVPFGRSSYILRYVHDATRQEVVIRRIWHGREARD